MGTGWGGGTISGGLIFTVRGPFNERASRPAGPRPCHVQFHHLGHVARRPRIDVGRSILFPFATFPLVRHVLRTSIMFSGGGYTTAGAADYLPCNKE